MDLFLNIIILLFIITFICFIHGINTILKGRKVEDVDKVRKGVGLVYFAKDLFIICIQLLIIRGLYFYIF